MPELEPEKFKQILSLSQAYKSGAQAELDKIYSMVEKEMFTEREPYATLGFSDKNGVSAYYSGNVTEEEARLCDEFCIAKSLSPLNTRLFKTGEKQLHLLACSAVEDPEKYPYIGEH